MERWDKQLRTFVENKRVDAFLEDIEKVSKLHNMCISHEDNEGGFVIRTRNKRLAEKVACADIGNVPNNQALQLVDWRASNWMPTDAPCWICGSRENTGLEPRFLYVVCEEHSELPPVQVSRLRKF